LQPGACTLHLQEDGPPCPGAQAISYNAIAEMMSGETDRRPGDFYLDPFNMCSTPEKLESMLEKEISHCRLAMFAFSGVVTQSALTGGAFPYTS